MTRYQIAGWAGTPIPDTLFGKPVAIGEKPADPQLMTPRYIELSNDQVIALLETNNIALVTLKSGGRLIYLEQKGKHFTWR